MTTTLETVATTKYARLADGIRQRIFDGDLQPGDRLPSFSEFRAQEGVTVSTVEKVFSTLERDGLIERFHGRGVFVKQKSKATKCLGFISRKQETAAWGLYWLQFMEGLQAAAHDAHYDILLINPGRLSSWQDKVDGVIFHEMTFKDYEQIKSSLAQVNVISSVPGLASVVADEFGGSHQAVRHLLDLGHSRIAYLLDDSKWQTQMRLTAYRAALREAGVEASPDWVRIFDDVGEGKFWGHLGKVQMTEWLANGWQELGCTALLCHNDEVAIGVMEALHEHGVKIPEDLSLVGYDGTILCETAHPKLTSIKVPLREIGSRAATLLIEQIESGKTDAVTLSLPTTLQLRGSTSRLAIPTS